LTLIGVKAKKMTYKSLCSLSCKFSSLWLHVAL